MASLAVIGLLAASMALGQGQAQAGQPDDHVQLEGELEYDCAGASGPREAVVTVDRTPEGYYATIHIADPCRALIYGLGGMGTAGLVYELEGDWETGFTGQNPGISVCAPATFLEIGPYGDGTDIHVWGWTLGVSACGTAWDGFLSDAELV